MKIVFDGMYVKYGIFQSRATKNAFLQSEKRPEFREKFSFSQSSSYCVKKPQFFDAPEGPAAFRDRPFFLPRIFFARSSTLFCVSRLAAQADTASL